MDDDERGDRSASEQPIPHRLIDVAITNSAVQEMLAHAREGFPVEIGGHLIGQRIVDQDSGRVYTYVELAMRAESISTHTHVSFLPTNAVRVHETCERLGMQVVGYYHSHPGFGVFQSGEDVRNFELYYPYDHQIAVVVDPTRVKKLTHVQQQWMGFFAWNQQRRPVLLPDAHVHLLVEPIPAPITPQPQPVKNAPVTTQLTGIPKTQPEPDAPATPTATTLPDQVGEQLPVTGDAPAMPEHPRMTDRVRAILAAIRNSKRIRNQ